MQLDARAHTHSHPVELLWAGDQLFAEAAACTTKETQETNIYHLSGFKPAIPAIKQFQTYILECTATKIGNEVYSNKY
jgi:hypothetical protein